jgi:phospholipid/cholesterol/gamma-HCH transport system ATP-binding protein
MIRFDHVSKALGGRLILDDMSLELLKGETLVVVGPSGAGKSVTLKHIVRLMIPDSGCVYVDGDPISTASGNDLSRLRDKIGFLFQGGALLAWLTVTENVALPLRERTNLSDKEILDRVQETLGLIGLEKDGHKFPSEISGGMRKRVGLARAIISRPDVVLYDEPTSGLDPVTSRRIDDLINNMRKELNITSVVVTHDLHSALSIGSRIAMLYGGKIVELSTPEEFLKSSQPQVKEFLDSQFITKQGSWERSPDV